MVDVTPRDSLKRQANRFFMIITAVLTMMARRASRLPLRLKAAAATEPAMKDDWKVELKSPRKLLRSISSRTSSFIRKKKGKEEEGKEWGDGGVWQKAILMGDKCEPLDFSGVMYYDSNGELVSEIPLITSPPR
ncbi:uncharacterized protein LOC133302171 [Gastrolobium bilobum]|uniref:uncharacterized protein LOC133302171 n=1 Tax=Gastrolobium bilobum TaxID=150636 RepID=UPI002AB213B0|nr:uncharacterized protein LOC133302171 [Gastrolobium bilobum]